MPEGLSTDGKEGGYVDKVGNQAYIYTGELEPPYLNRLEGHPYLDTRNYRKGALAFDGGVYPGIGMRLNVYIERLIVLSPDRRLHVIVPPGTDTAMWIDEVIDRSPRNYRSRMRLSNHRSNPYFPKVRRFLIHAPCRRVYFRSSS